MKIQFEPIGIIHSPFKDLEQMPIQPTGFSSADGYAEVFTEFVEGLKDLDGFSHIILLYHLHRTSRIDLVVTPFLGQELRGIFATRAPTRPNPLGLSIVKLIRIEHEKIYLSNIDILDDTPLLDIKPYVPEFDQQQDVRIGWLTASRSEIKDKKSDNRFK